MEKCIILGNGKPETCALISILNLRGRLIFYVAASVNLLRASLYIYVAVNVNLLRVIYYVPSSMNIRKIKLIAYIYIHFSLSLVEKLSTQSHL